MANNFGGFFVKVGNEGRKYTEITKLNNQITETKNRINQLYREMGEMYCQLHLHDPEPQMIKHISAIEEMKANIEIWNDRILDLRGMTKCTHCGKVIPKNMMFCSGCGQRAIPDNVTVCPGCGTVVAKGTMFCSNCGHRIMEEEQQVKQVEKKIIRHCTNCNAVLEENALFCPCCGTRVEAEVPQEEVSIDSDPLSVIDSVDETAAPVPAQIICSKCGQAIEEGEAFCPNCGAPAQKMDESVPFASEESVINLPKLCPNCGSELAEDEMFCSNCGSKVM